MAEYIKEVANAPKPVGPYCTAVKHGNLLFVSGQLGLDPNSGKMVEGGVEAEMKQILANLSAVLEGAGTSTRQILMTTIFLTAIADGKIVNELYSKFVIEGSVPARQTVAVKELPLGGLVEISVIAAA